MMPTLPLFRRPVSGGYDALLRFYTKKARIYERRWAYYHSAVLRSALSRLHLDGNEKMLDVACGTGLFVRAVKRKWPGVEIAGLDLCRSMLHLARERMPDDHEASWMLGNAERLPLRPSCFDVVLCANSFHYFKKETDALAELVGAVKPGGRLVIVDWCGDYAICRLLELWLRLADPSHHRIHTLKSCLDLIRSHGLEIRRSERFKIDWFWGLMYVEAVKSRTIQSPNACPGPK